MRLKAGLSDLNLLGSVPSENLMEAGLLYGGGKKGA